MNFYLNNYFFFFFFTFINSNIIVANTDFPEFDEEVIEERLQEMECLVRPKLTTPVEGYIKGYTIRNRARTERIIGRSTRYFPLFEKYLKENDLPEDLKYLSVVESALVPKALSRVGAGGLWQFMPATGASYGLEITRYVDDRSCPHKSTQAAVKHLSKLYGKYNNWELALAAYNSGAGRVNRAIKRARSRNFWKIQRYLPRETRNYVPAFIAATYLLKHYQAHALVPVYPELDLQLTESIRVYNYLPFQKIQEITGLSRAVVEELNPSYTRGFIPSNNRGNYLTLPKRVMLAFRDYQRQSLPDHLKAEPMESTPIYVRASEKNESKSLYFKSIYTVMEGDSLDFLGHLFNCEKQHLMLWNQLPDSALVAGQQLEIYYPAKILRYRPEEKTALTTLPSVAIAEVNSSHLKKKTSRTPLKAIAQSYIYHRLKRYESLKEVAEKYQGVTVTEIMGWNNFTKKTMPKVGENIKIFLR